MQRAVATVALVLLVASAGCNQVLQKRTPPVTRGTFDVPDDPATTSTTTAGTPDPDSDVAPGLASHGIRDAFELTSAHRERLTDSSFTGRRTYVVRAENGSLLWRHAVDVAVAANRTRFSVVVDGDRFRRSDSVHRFFSAGDDAPVYHARIDDGRTEYETTGREVGGDVPVRDVLLGDPTYHSRLYRLLGTVQTAEVSPDDQPRPQGYVVRAKTFTDTYLIRGFGRADVTNVSMVAVVEDDGLIRRLYLTYETRIDDRPVRVQETYTFRAVGETTVEPPAWVAKVTDQRSDAEDGTTGGNGTTARE